MTLTIAPGRDLVPVPKTNGAAKPATASTVSTRARMARLHDELAALARSVSTDLAEIKSQLALTEARVGRVDQWTAIGDGGSNLAKIIAASVGKLFGEVYERLDAVERRPPSFGVRWGGVWSEGFYSEAGMLVTDHGSIWLCTRSTGERPGSNDSFRLICKGDRDRQRRAPQVRRWRISALARRR